jgi:beta-phosphoglucomutase
VAIDAGSALASRGTADLLRAIVFDFDGVIVDSEPLIFRLTQQMAAMEGWTITEEDYYRDYLALDDRGIVEHLYRTHGLRLEPARRDELVQWKARAYAEAIRHGLPPLPGAVEAVRELALDYPLAIASGSLRSEVEYLLGRLNLRDQFAVLATADDVERSKPDPAIFHVALERLAHSDALRQKSGGAPLRAAECLAIEDAPAGVTAAHAAGLKCLAIGHSRPLSELAHADWAVRDFTEVDFAAIRRAFQAADPS